MKPNNILIFACAQSVEGVPEVIKLLPLGHVSSQKGNFLVDKESFDEMKARFVSHGVDIVIDYEHQTLQDVQAPAGGWIKDLFIDDGAIAAKVEWTPKAREYLQNREYRYLSPVVNVRESDGKAVSLHSAALTNAPAIDGMFPIINSENFKQGESGMNFLQQLAALFGLGENATETDVLTAAGKMLEANKSGLVANKTILSLLSLKDGSTTADVAAKITTMQNPANFVTVEQYNLVANKLAEVESADLIERALKNGKITPAQKDWAKRYVLSDKEGFERFLEITPPVVPMERLSPQSDKSKKTEAIDPVICKSLGIGAAEIEKYEKDEA